MNRADLLAKNRIAGTSACGNRGWLNRNQDKCLVHPSHKEAWRILANWPGLVHLGMHAHQSQPDCQDCDCGRGNSCYQPGPAKEDLNCGPLDPFTSMRSNPPYGNLSWNDHASAERPSTKQYERFRKSRLRSHDERRCDIRADVRYGCHATNA